MRHLVTLAIQPPLFHTPARSISYLICEVHEGLLSPAMRTQRGFVPVTHTGIHQIRALSSQIQQRHPPLAHTTCRDTSATSVSQVISRTFSISSEPSRASSNGI